MNLILIHHCRQQAVRIAWFSAFAVALVAGREASAQGRPAAVDDILLARPFTLEQPYVSRWQAEEQEVASGQVVVLRVRPSLVQPRAGATQVLCAGEVTVEWLNSPYPSGVLIGVIRTDLDPLDTLIWFARHGYPEEMTTERIASERLLALETGITPLDPARVTLALAEGGAPLQATDRAELLAYADDLAAIYIPESE